MKANLNNSKIRAFIQEHENDDAAELMLKAHKYPELPMKEVAVQIASRQKAKDKLPEWYSNEEIIFPPKQNLEQASSELTATFKSRFLRGKQFIDLTGGTGIDTFYIAQNFDSSVYIEPNAELCELAAHNFEQLGASIEIRNTTAEEVLNSDDEKVDWLFLDPSRRDELKNRVYALEDCVPDVIQLKDTLLNSADQVLIKCSPMLDIKKTIRQFSACYRVQIVALDNDVKELLIYLRSGFDGETEIEAWNLSDKHEEQSFVFNFGDEQQAISEIGTPLNYLYEPNAPLMKAGPYNLIANKFKLKKLHSNTHLYTSEQLVEDFPGKKLVIKEVFKPSKKEIRQRITNGTVNVIVRNYPMGANEIKKKFNLKDGGEEFLVFCEIEGEGLKVIWCNRK